MHTVTPTLPKGDGLQLNTGLDFYITTPFATNWRHFRELKLEERFPLNTLKASEIGRDFSFIKSPLKWRLILTTHILNKSRNVWRV